MYTLRCTQKLLERIKQPIVSSVPTPTTGLGNWYATALFSKPQVALFVNEATRLPVLMPLAPASKLAARFPLHLAEVLSAHGVGPAFIAREIMAMVEVEYAKTDSRSILGTMNDFSWLAQGNRNTIDLDELLAISVRLAKAPIGGAMGYKFPLAMLGKLVENCAE